MGRGRGLLLQALPRRVNRCRRPLGGGTRAAARRSPTATRARPRCHALRTPAPPLVALRAAQTHRRRPCGGCAPPTRVARRLKRPPSRTTRRRTWRAPPRSTSPHGRYTGGADKNPGGGGAHRQGRLPRGQPPHPPGAAAVGSVRAARVGGARASCAPAPAHRPRDSPRGAPQRARGRHPTPSRPTGAAAAARGGRRYARSSGAPREAGERPRPARCPHRRRITRTIPK